MSRSFIIFIFFGITCALIACNADLTIKSTCVSCHQVLEPASVTHPICIDCHGGDSKSEDKNVSHQTMLGPKNPSDPKFWEQTCGKCHPYQLNRVRATIMLTNTGMIKNIQKTWEGEDNKLYSTQPENLFSANGMPLELKDVSQLNNLSGELYRKFCSQCHVGIEADGKYAASHASGCAACHFPYNDIATYQGNDLTVKGKQPYSANHRLAALPGNDVCLRCHNRSGRMALSYQGLHDGNNGLVPTRNGLPGPRIISGARNLTYITEDIHFAGGMDCIDCHTSRDIMGDGYAYENMYHQTEIRCEDCHGTGKKHPDFREITRENDEAMRESKSYSIKMQPGMKMIVTGKGRNYSNVFYESGKVYVLSKRTGKLHQTPLITGTPEHTIAGHERMECYTCHSRAVPQCFGCHTRYDQTKLGKDYIKDRETKGKFSETEDWRKLYPFPLSLNQRGKISPVTPGCQTFVTVVDEYGRTTQKEYVAKFKGKKQLRFAPFYSHNTGRTAVGCSECHANPIFLGFGQHVVNENSIQATLLCEKSKEKPLDGFLKMKNGNVSAFSGITRENSRPLNGSEIKRILAVNQCLVCHDDPKDPIYQKPLDETMLNICLNRSGPATIELPRVRKITKAYPVMLEREKVRFQIKDIPGSTYNVIFDQMMSTRSTEKAFVQKTLGKEDPEFFHKNCESCHVKSCDDCHKRDGDVLIRPTSSQCLDCHKGYFTGWEYYGRAPREDNLRYQRGKTVEGETFLKMLPDIHARAGMECGDCHSMKSLMAGKKSSKTCVDCHKADPAVIEHRIDAHKKNLECYACHSAWASQEYGTFFVRFKDSSNKQYFRLRPWGNENYIKSGFIKKQDSPPLGINQRGKISPIRPQFIVYFTDIENNKPVGEENRLLAARWKAFFPHTIARGTVMCDGCHNNAERFLLEKEEDRMYRLQKNGMTLTSFWSQKGQTVGNGSFISPERFKKMTSKPPEFKNAYVKKWKRLIKAVEN
ncbi:MAG: selenite/tellurite reduction operon c-type cytochrome ExtM [Desulfobacterales bacterium]